MHKLNDILPHIYNQQVAQRQLFLTCQQLAGQGKKGPGFRDVAFRNYSQTDEDGILFYIFSQIGFTNRLLVDIAFGNPFGANATNLICNWGFTGLLVEGDPQGVEKSIKFFSSHPDTYVFPPKTICHWVTAENINPLIESHGISGEVDLFSLDVDGIDYWLWEKLSVIRPRVVVMEAQTFWGTEKSVTVPYKPDFNRFDVHADYCGASIAAFVKLSHTKGYRLVACNRFGYNIFFVRNDIAADLLPEITIEECFSFLPPGLAENRKERLGNVSKYEWVEV